jgi:hypothetical protein
VVGRDDAPTRSGRRTRCRQSPLARLAVYHGLGAQIQNRNHYHTIPSLDDSPRESYIRIQGNPTKSHKHRAYSNLDLGQGVKTPKPAMFDQLVTCQHDHSSSQYLIDIPAGRPRRVPSATADPPKGCCVWRALDLDYCPAVTPSRRIAYESLSCSAPPF